jgi:hypothetical protein
MTTISGWASRPWFWPMVFFILSAVGSTYAAQIRVFLKSRPYKFRRFLLNRKVKRLELLQRLHGNDPPLVLWGFHELRDTCKFILRVWVGIFIALGIPTMAHHAPGKIASLYGVFIAAAAGTLPATISRAYKIVSALYRYENSVIALGAQIEKLSARIAKS